MSGTNKKPSNASIRRALTTLKKAEIITGQEIDPTNGRCAMILNFDNNLLSPKKTTKKRLPKRKKVSIGNVDNPLNVSR
jgi:hypothetical protein